jgi:hypothetical protein
MMSSLCIRRCLRRLSLAALTLVAVTACGPFRRGAGPPPATLIFTNGSLDQAAVYVIGPGLDFTRIGTVFAGRTDTLTVSAALATRGSLNIVARLLASHDLPQTGPVVIQPGQAYEVRLLPSSSLLSFLPSRP